MATRCATAPWGFERGVRLEGTEAPIDTKLVNRWPASRIDELMPWAYAKQA
jgi:hypothetical protein